MKYPLLTSIFFLSTIVFSLQAQTLKKDQIWVDITTSFGLLDFAPFKLGMGGGIQLGVDLPISSKSALGLHAGVNRMGNYNRVYGIYSYDILPDGYQQIERTTKIQAFTFIDIGAHFKHRPSLDSPWSWSIGANFSIVAQPTGRYYNREGVNLQQPLITETEYVSALVSRGSVSSGSLSMDDFSEYDINAEAILYYEITKGCALRASFRQGMINLIKPTLLASSKPQHYLSMLGLGFSARLR